MCYNLFGWLPSPAIYGYICEYSGEGVESRWGMWALTQSILVAIVFVTLAFFSSHIKCCKKKVEVDDEVA